MRALLILLIAFLSQGAQGQVFLRHLDMEGRPGEVNFKLGKERMDQPLIIALHGSSGNSIQFQVQSDLIGKVDRKGFRLALLNGQPWGWTYYGKQRSWNSGNCCEHVEGDDIAYLASVIERLQKNAVGQGRKVILVGHSNGSMMSYRLMCQRPGLIDGVVGIAGTVSFSGCTPSHTRIIHIHGTIDSIVPLIGDTDPEFGINFESLAAQDVLFSHAGIRWTNFVVEGANHSLPDINRKLEAQYGFSVGDIVVALAEYGQIGAP